MNQAAQLRHVLALLLPVLGLLLFAGSVLRLIRKSAEGESVTESLITMVFSVGIGLAGWWVSTLVPKPVELPENAPKIVLLPFDVADARLEPADVAVAQAFLDTWVATLMNHVGYRVVFAGEAAGIMTGLGLPANGACDAACGLRVAEAVHASGYAITKIAAYSSGQKVGTTLLFDRDGQEIDSIPSSGTTLMAVAASIKADGVKTWSHLLQTMRATDPKRTEAVSTGR